MGAGLILPGSSKDNDNQWEIFSMGLSPIVPKRFLELPGQVNPQNYVVYNIQLKKVPVEVKDLKNWLGNAIIENSQTGIVDFGTLSIA